MTDRGGRNYDAPAIKIARRWSRVRPVVYVARSTRSPNVLLTMNAEGSCDYVGFMEAEPLATFEPDARDTWRPIWPKS